MPEITILMAERLGGADLDDLCHASEDAVREGIGLHWTEPPAREVLESYWRGVMIVPERILFMGRIDGTVAGAIQLVKPPHSKQSMAFQASVTTHFVASWARGHGMARMLLQAAEDEARRLGFITLNLDVRTTQDAAISLYESCGYQRWGTLPKYEKVGERFIAGHYYYKTLQETD